MGLTRKNAQESLELGKTVARKLDADRQNTVHPFVDLSGQYPAVNPRGLYSALDMEYRQRIERLNVRMASADPGVRDYVNRVLYSERMIEMTKELRAAAAYDRALDIALEITPEVQQEDRAELEEEKASVRSRQTVKDMDRLFSCLEYVLGMGKKPGPEELTVLHRFGLPNPDRVLGDRTLCCLSPKLGYRVNIPSLSGILEEHNRHQHFNSAEEEQAENRRQSVKFFEALGRRVFEPFAEGTNPGEVSLEDRVLIGMMTGREAIDHALGKRGPGTPAQRKALLYQMLGAAVSDPEKGPKIDVIPKVSSDGNHLVYSERPIPVQRTLESAESLFFMSVWHWLLTFLGLYSKELEMENRTREVSDRVEKLDAMLKSIRKKEGCSLGPTEPEQNRQEQELLASGRDEYYSMLARLDGARDPCFDLQKYLPQIKVNPRPESYRMMRDNRWSLTLGILCRNGHSLEDILDPEKLQEEKKAVAEELADRVEKDDLEWFTRTMTEGTEAMIRQIDERLRRVDIRKDAQLMEVLPVLMYLGAAVFNHCQELNVPGVRESFVRSRFPKECEGIEDLTGYLKTNEGKELFNRAVLPYDRVAGWVYNLEQLYRARGGLIRSGVGQDQRDFHRSLGSAMMAEECRKMLAGAYRTRSLKEIEVPSMAMLDVSFEEPLTELSEHQTRKDRLEAGWNALRGVPNVRPGMEVRLQKLSGEGEQELFAPTVSQSSVTQCLQKELQEIRAAKAKYDSDSLAFRKACIPTGLESWTQLGEKDIYRLDRTMPQHFCMGMLLRAGHSMEDILNPEKLQAEKRQAGDELRQHMESDDVTWVAVNMMEGLKKVNDVLEEQVRDLCKNKLQYNQEYLLTQFNTLFELGRCAHDLNQETDFGVPDGMKGVREVLWEDPNYGRERCTEQQGRALAFASFTDALFQGMYAGKDLIYGHALGEKNSGQAYSGYLALLQQDYVQGQYPELLLCTDPKPDYLALKDKPAMVSALNAMSPHMQRVKDLLCGNDVQQNTELSRRAMLPLAKAVLAGRGPDQGPLVNENGRPVSKLGSRNGTIVRQIEQAKQGPAVQLENQAEGPALQA